jgi:hypothetical protein
MRDCLSIGHSVTLEAGSEGEHISVDIQLFETLCRHFAAHDNPIAERMIGDIGIKPHGHLGVARAVAGNRQSPRQFNKRRQSGDQHVKALPWH